MIRINAIDVHTVNARVQELVENNMFLAYMLGEPAELVIKGMQTSKRLTPEWDDDNQIWYVIGKGYPVEIWNGCQLLGVGLAGEA